MTTVVMSWLALGIVTIALAIYRKVLVNREDTSIHLTHGGGAMVADQAAFAGKLGIIDRWGKTLTVVTFALGVVIGGVYIFEALRAVPI